MRNVCRVVLGSLIIGCYSVALHAAPPVNPIITPAQKAAVTRAVDKLSKQADKKLSVTAITASPIPGLLQVTSDMMIFYVSSDGEYILYGDLLDLNRDKNSWSLTENESRKLRVQALQALNDNDIIIFPSTAKKKIGTVYVFTDIDCPYCHKLQENIKDYTNAGIEIRYLSFPRSGPNTQSFDEAIRVWCAADKPKAYNDAIELKEYPKETCKKNPVMMEFELGQKMSINGTPTLILDNGLKIGGLIDAKGLVKIINDSRKS